MAISQNDFQYVSDLVRTRSAIALDEGKMYLAESRLSILARHEGFDSLETLLNELLSSKSKELSKKVVEAMTTNETTFFRDIHPFDALRETIIPDLLQQRVLQRQFVIWCGAASSGQEPYSIAMLIRERFPELLKWNLQIIATDLSTHVLERAGKGLYSQLEVNRGLPAALLVKYFEKCGMEWQIKDEIRRMVSFRPMNLIEPWTNLPRCDIVMLRNVLIYFEVTTKQQILSKVREHLRPDGYLFLGGAETTLNLDDHFVRVSLDRSSCYRLQAAKLVAATAASL